MAIEINSFFGGICNSIYSATGFNRILSSVVYTSLTMSIMIIIAIMLIYPAKKNSPSWLLLKLFLYIFIGITFMFSIHSSFIRNNYKEKYLNSNVNTLMNNIHGGEAVYNNEKIKVQPNLEIKEEPEEVYEPVKEEPNSLSAMIDDLEKRM